MLQPKEKLKRWEEAMRDVYGFYSLFGQQNSQEIFTIQIQSFEPGRKKEACLTTF